MPGQQSLCGKLTTVATSIVLGVLACIHAECIDTADSLGSAWTTNSAACRHAEVSHMIDMPNIFKTLVLYRHSRAFGSHIRGFLTQHLEQCCCCCAHDRCFSVVCKYTNYGMYWCRHTSCSSTPIFTSVSCCHGSSKQCCCCFLRMIQLRLFTADQSQIQQSLGWGWWVMCGDVSSKMSYKLSNRVAICT